MVLGFFFQAEDGIRDGHVTGVQTCALPISGAGPRTCGSSSPRRPWRTRGPRRPAEVGTSRGGGRASRSRPRVWRTNRYVPEAGIYLSRGRAAHDAYARRHLLREVLRGHELDHPGVVGEDDPREAVEDGPSELVDVRAAVRAGAPLRRRGRPRQVEVQEGERRLVERRGIAP